MMKTSGEEFPAETVGIKVPAGDEARQEKEHRDTKEWLGGRLACRNGCEET
jgi:hypothetical protein